MQNEFLKEYLSCRHRILVELLQHESLPSKTSCSNCQQSSGTHHCQDCFGSNFWCDPCCVSTHERLPFHCIQMWNGHFFEWWSATPCQKWVKAVQPCHVSLVGQPQKQSPTHVASSKNQISSKF